MIEEAPISKPSGPQCLQLIRRMITRFSMDVPSVDVCSLLKFVFII